MILLLIVGAWMVFLPALFFAGWILVALWDRSCDHSARDRIQAHLAADRSWPSLEAEIEHHLQIVAELECWWSLPAVKR